jgi:hypothetical protein
VNGSAPFWYSSARMAAGTFAPKSPNSGPPASFTFCAAASYSAQVVGGVMPYWSKMSLR